MFCSASFASVSDSAMFTSPLPSVFVGVSKLVPEIVKSFPLRRLMTSVLAFASEPASFSYFWMSWSVDCAAAGAATPENAAPAMSVTRIRFDMEDPFDWSRLNVRRGSRAIVEAEASVVVARQNADPGYCLGAASALSVFRNAARSSASLALRFASLWRTASSSEATEPSCI
jgi:hypothetical protein